MRQTQLVIYRSKISKASVLIKINQLPKSTKDMGGLSFFLHNFTNFLNLNFANLLKLLFPVFIEFPGFIDELPSKLLPEEISVVTRPGRDRQRYVKGYRQVVGCIPYRYKKTNQLSSIDGNCVQELQVLVISAQNGHGMLFPKGGWELGETMEEAALRETEEEAGVTGEIEGKLGEWQYMSKRGGIMHVSYMFPLLVQNESDDWQEKIFRKREWVTVSKAREVCHNVWMKQALEELVRRKIPQQQAQESNETTP